MKRIGIGDYLSMGGLRGDLQNINMAHCSYFTVMRLERVFEVRGQERVFEVRGQERVFEVRGDTWEMLSV